jgi:dTDP-4-amino-4,6-dideoxygalactose transaminase
MIPRFKPCLGLRELAAVCRARAGAVERFEAAFARAFGPGQALAFSYGRSALWAFLQAVGLQGAEVIQPAYTCSVVAHATVLSGNVPRFVDVRLPGCNMDLDHVAAAITGRTRAILATHLFGYPLDTDRLGEIVHDAERRHGHKIWVIQDCAHAFGARRRGRPVARAGDAALFGLNVSKMMTSVFGGMLYTEDPALAAAVRDFRDKTFRRPGLVKRLRRRCYLFAVYLAFTRGLYSLVHWLQERTPLLDRFTRAYHLDEEIRFPPDYLEGLSACEAEVGLVQLGRYPDILRARRDHAVYYNDHLPRRPGWVLPPLEDGATYSHYVVRVPDREAVLTALARRGIQLGRLIEYSVPELRPYRAYAGPRSFPAARLCSTCTINLPVYAQLSPACRERVVRAIEALGTPAASRAA